MFKPIRLASVALLWWVLLGLALPALEAMQYKTRLAASPVPQTLVPPVRTLRTRGITDTWHAVRPGGRRHEGVDLFAARGTPIYSTTEGLLLRRSVTGLGGKVVWVLGPGGQRHYYAHLDSFSHLSAGERVSVGTVLGYVGNSGNAKSTPPHLHYGIYGRRGAINPYPLLAGRTNPQRTIPAK